MTPGEFASDLPEADDFPRAEPPPSSKRRESQRDSPPARQPPALLSPNNASPAQQISIRVSPFPIAQQNSTPSEQPRTPAAVLQARRVSTRSHCPLTPKRPAG